MRFGVAVSTANTWVKRFQAPGSLAPGQIGGHKPAVLSGAHRDWLLARCKNGDFTLRGLVAELAAERGLKVDHVSVWRFVHAEGLTHKKDRPGQRAGPPGHSPAPGTVAALAALDQSGTPGVHRRDTDQDRHGAVARLGAKRPAPAGPHALWALEHHDLFGGTPALAALRHDRIDAPFLLEGPVNHDSSLAYVGEVLAPTLSSGDVVVADNLACHKHPDVRRALRAAGAILLLPKYSPDLNPIEQVFAKLKHLLRKAQART